MNNCEIFVRSLKVNGFDRAKGTSGVSIDSTSLQQYIYDMIKDKLSNHFQEINFYHGVENVRVMQGITGKRLYILHDTENIKVDNFTKRTILSTDVEGNITSQYIEEYLISGEKRECNTILINEDLITSIDGLNSIKSILDKFIELIIQPGIDANSWSKTKDKDKLISELAEMLKKDRDRDLEDIKRRIERQKETIEQRKRQLNDSYKSFDDIMNSYKIREANSMDLTGKLVGDMDLISKLKKVKDIKIENNNLVVVTNPLTIHSSNRKFYGGEYSIFIKLNNNDISIFGKEQNKGFWSRKDSHPHVDGRNGKACFGNLHSTLIELMNQREIYALVLSLIDFLESVNTSDPAGERVYEWKEIK